MNTPISPDSLVCNIIVNTLSNSISPPPKNDKYRYYHCYPDKNNLKCKKVDGSNNLPSKDDSLLLFVGSHIPEEFDKYILKYKWIPNTVIIENNST